MFKSIILSLISLYVSVDNISSIDYFYIIKDKDISRDISFVQDEI